jgi:membrane protease YdiL (CAAX protease family)
MAAGTSDVRAVYLAAIVVWVLFDRVAALTASTRGEAGLAVCAVVLAALVIAERVLHRHAPAEALRALGYGAPRARAMAVVLVVSALLLAVLPLSARVVGTPIALRSDWLTLVPGLFAQAGLAEETLFRGFLFGHLRRTRTFWRAALLALPPFFLVHLLLFATMSFPVAAAATLLSLVLSFPFARLYDLGGATIWAPAILHAVVQGGIKIVEIPEDRMLPIASIWMGASMVIPWIAFAVKAREPETSTSVR